jgi:hypothetical protein
LPFLDRKPAIPHTFLIEPLNGLKLTTKKRGGGRHASKQQLLSQEAIYS